MSIYSSYYASILIPIFVVAAALIVALTIRSNKDSSETDAVKNLALIENKTTIATIDKFNKQQLTPFSIILKNALPNLDEIISKPLQEYFMKMLFQTAWEEILQSTGLKVSLSMNRIATRSVQVMKYEAVIGLHRYTTPERHDQMLALRNEEPERPRLIGFIRNDSIRNDSIRSESERIPFIDLFMLFFVAVMKIAMNFAGQLMKACALALLFFVLGVMKFAMKRTGQLRKRFALALLFFVLRVIKFAIKFAGHLMKAFSRAGKQVSKNFRRQRQVAKGK